MYDEKHLLTDECGSYNEDLDVAEHSINVGRLLHLQVIL
jgi:hypothetical protein